ncbi:Hypothetical protein NCS54_01214800 [Fusarium falciforme]|uniref:Hypothetical protein n=1 Tax=Fusarium falciforme TaxID=195108 RepID=UPI002301B445|nr:Hypothetical protein NCS54_01214800 [Fusarium falciforme]WAO94559.1 Hypothetical protein NCS54_01214800 [Fusarium falciforme]
MTRSIILTPFFLSQDSIKLGRFVTRIDHPHQNHHDPPSAGQPRVLVSLLDSYTGQHETASRSAFNASLTSLLSASFSKRAKMKICVATDRVKTYTLDNSDSWFDEAIGQAATRGWIERALDRGEDIYMIVGYRTVTDASVSQASILGNSAEGQITVPATLSLAAAGAIVPIGGLLDPSVGIRQQGLDGATSQFMAPGEQVCAFEYRKLCHRWLSSKHVDNSRLSGVRQWSSVERSRDEEDGEDDVIEVELTEVDDLDGDLDGDWDKEVVGNETIFMRSSEK